MGPTKLRAHRGGRPGVGRASDLDPTAGPATSSGHEHLRNGHFTSDRPSRARLDGFDRSASGGIPPSGQRLTAPWIHFTGAVALAFPIIVGAGPVAGADPVASASTPSTVRGATHEVSVRTARQLITLLHRGVAVSIEELTQALKRDKVTITIYPGRDGGDGPAIIDLKDEAGHLLTNAPTLEGENLVRVALGLPPRAEPTKKPPVEAESADQGRLDADGEFESNGAPAPPRWATTGFFEMFIDGQKTYVEIVQRDDERTPWWAKTHNGKLLPLCWSDDEGWSIDGETLEAQQWEGWSPRRNED